MILKKFQVFCHRFWAHLIAHPLLLINAVAYGSIAYIVMPGYLRFALSFFSINVGFSGLMFLVTGLTVLYILIPYLQTVFAFNKWIEQKEHVSDQKEEIIHKLLAENLVKKWVKEDVLYSEKEGEMSQVVLSSLLKNRFSKKHLSLNDMKERHRILKGFEKMDDEPDGFEEQSIKKVDDRILPQWIKAMLSDLQHLKFRNDIDQYFSEQHDQKDDGPISLFLRFVVIVFALFSGFNIIMLLVNQLLPLNIFHGFSALMKSCTFVCLGVAGILNVQVFSGLNAKRGWRLVKLYWEIYKDLGWKKFLDKCSFQQVWVWISGICQVVASFLFSTSLYLHLLPKLLAVSNNVPVFCVFFQWLNSQLWWVVPLAIICCAVVTLFNYIEQIISLNFINDFNATSSLTPKRKAEKLSRPVGAVLPFLKGSLIVAVTGTQLIIYFDSIVSALSSVAMTVWVEIFAFIVVGLIAGYWWNTFKDTITQIFEIPKVNAAKKIQPVSKVSVPTTQQVDNASFSPIIEDEVLVARSSTTPRRRGTITNLSSPQ